MLICHHTMMVCQTSNMPAVIIFKVKDEQKKRHFEQACYRLKGKNMTQVLTETVDKLIKEFDKTLK